MLLSDSFSRTLLPTRIIELRRNRPFEIGLAGVLNSGNAQTDSKRLRSVPIAALTGVAYRQY
jgi:hypothetical protein